MLAICPFCLKTIEVERAAKFVCPECGNQFGYAELQRKHFIVDKRTEETEHAAAVDYFRNSEFRSAAEHFERALEANANSYSAKYFSMLCGIYLRESGVDYDVMAAVVNMLRESLVTLSRANAAVSDKLAFITAMLNESKIIVTRRLTERDELFENNIEEYRKVSISDLTKLLELFKIDREQIMSFAPEIAKVLAEIVDCALKVCYKAVQTVAIGEELHTPSDADYKKLLSLSNDYCFFGHSFDPSFDTKVYSPDFSQNYMFNEKVLARFAKFDEENRVNAKKHIIGNIDEYDSILAECAKALKFTYLNCYRSMCSRQVKEHAQLFTDGFKMLYRLLMPRVVQADKKRIEIRIAKFVDIVDYCDILTRFLVDAYELDGSVAAELHNYYEELYNIVNMYFVPEMNRLSKQNITDEVRGIVQKTMYDCAVCCAPALRKYVDFSAETDKVRVKLVKLCKEATESFLLRSGMSIDEIEQSNFYRPILQLSTAVLDEDDE